MYLIRILKKWLKPTLVGLYIKSPNIKWNC
jgi:hypothetical protein